VNGSAKTAEMRLARPEVESAWYAYEHGRYWIIERRRDGSCRQRLLPAPPVGAVCFNGRDSLAPGSTFIVPPVPGRPNASAAQILCILAAVAAIPLAFALLPGSVPIVALAAGGFVAALALVQARMEHLRRRDPGTADRIAATAVVYLAATHHRHANHR
jgi:hypothetical protein